MGSSRGPRAVDRSELYASPSKNGLITGYNSSIVVHIYLCEKQQHSRCPQFRTDRMTSLNQTMERDQTAGTIQPNRLRSSPIAIVGMAARLPVG